jgi:predicted LPLAT superfamily acyltransferase
MAAAEAATKGLEPLKKKVEEAAEAAKAIQKALLEAQKQQAPTVAPTATAPQAATAVSPQMNEADMAKLVADMVAADPELAKLFGGAEATKPAAPTVTATNQTLAPTTTTANLGAAGPAGATNTVTAQPTTPAPAANPMAAIMELLGSAKA